MTPKKTPEQIESERRADSVAASLERQDRRRDEFFTSALAMGLEFHQVESLAKIAGLS